MQADIQQLLQQVEQLHKENKSQEIVDLLTDALLQAKNNAELYAWKGRALGNLNETEEALKHAHVALHIDPNCALAFLVKGNIWSDKSEFDKAIEDYNKAIELDPNNSNAYNNRGNTWNDKSEFDKAIEDYTKTIALDPNDSKAYYNRGIAWYNNSEYDKAIEDYNKAIELDSDFSKAYNNRGLAWNNKDEYDKAIEDYTKAIVLDPNNSKAYYNRGNAWYNKGEYDKAIEDYTKAISLDPNYSSAYHNRGNAWYDKSEYYKAIEDYDQAIALDGNNKLAYTNRGLAFEEIGNNEAAKFDYEKALAIDKDYTRAIRLRNELFAKLGIPVDWTSAKDDNSLYRIVEAVKTLDQKDGLVLIQDYKLQIVPLLNEIKKYTTNISQQDRKPQFIAHYTNLKVADIVFTKDSANTLRYSNAVFVNDPEEGKTLIDFLDSLDKKNDDPIIKDAFYRIAETEPTHFYIGSFIPGNEYHEDELLMWRTYGKDEDQQEAAGCCLILDSSFFDTPKGDSLAILGKEDDNISNACHCLYKVLYCDKRRETIVDDDGDALKKILIELVTVLRTLLNERQHAKNGKLLHDEKNTAIEKIVYHSLSELRYLFKSSDYSYESEYRVIQFATHQDVVHIDDKSTALPRRMYIESTKKLSPHIKKIILGPKVPQPERWMYLQERLKRDGRNVELVKSNCKFQ